MKRTTAGFFSKVICTLAAAAAPIAAAQERGTPLAPPPPAAALEQANVLSVAFAHAAEVIGPSVVSVRVVKTPQISRRSGDAQNPLPGLPFDDDFLRRFFGERLPRELPPQEGMGSGVIVSTDGYILTNNHVAGDADELEVTLQDGRTLRAEAVGTDPLSDLAVIRVKAGDLPAAQLGDSDALRVGEWVLAAGNPFGLRGTITAGIVSAKGRSNMRIVEYEDFIQTDAAINPGNSGGPLVNLRGEVVGINTAIATRTGSFMGAGFAIPISMARSIMRSLIEEGHVTRGYLGVLIQPLSEELARSFGYDSTRGALITQVLPNEPADKAGLRPGDIVVKFQDQEVRDSTQLRNQIAATEPGSKAEFEVYRDGDRRTFTATIGEREGGAVTRSGRRDQSSVLGLTVTNISAEQARQLDLPTDVRGVLITEVEPGTPAARAGLTPGQIIEEVQGTPVSSVADFRRQLEKRDLEQGVRLLVRVGDGKQFVFLRTESE